MTPHVLTAEDRYSALSNAISQGFCLLQVEFDAAGTAIDYRFIETNALFEAHSGLENAVGRSARELVPGLEHFWIERYAQVAHSRKPIHFEQRSEAMDRLFDVHAFPVGPADAHLVGLLFEDVTAERARQDNSAFLVQVSTAFESEMPLAEIMASVGRKLGDYMGTNSCLFCEVHEEADTITTSFGWTREGEPTLIRTFRISDYLSVEFLDDSRAGRTVAVADTATDSRTDAAAYAELNIGAFVTIPYYAGRVWTHFFAVTDARPRQWTGEELDLLQSFARLVFSKLERARGRCDPRKRSPVPDDGGRGSANRLDHRCAGPGGVLQPAMGGIHRNSASA
ncbi:GAF domain-containing protein [Lysobacter korlensis]|uniref:GAF domain-containing protein n=1 Tax=Lysobacter korlensis TaxID=553636 RepID=A0ABV6S174_9GAMM